MPSLPALLKGLICGSSEAAVSGTVITRPGLFDATPDVALSLLAPGPKVAAALTGPDKGVTTLTQQPLGTEISWVTQSQQASDHQQQQPQQQQQQQNSLHPQQQPQQQQQQLQQRQQAWGSAISLYELDPLTGQRNGDPIADCFASITYLQGAVLALADGVNWGEKPKQAARGAVLGFCSSLHRQLAYAQGGRKLSSEAAFAALRSAVLAAQQQVLAAEGTLTTLVGAVVCPKRWGGGHALLAVCIGDSPCYVWRAATGTVEEVTHLPPLHGFHRDPRVCPGCLGHAVGDQPDLSNITYSLTQLQQGDVVFLASDGVADNFDPVMRKQALASALPSKSPRASAAAAAAAQAALNGDFPDMNHSHLYSDISPASPASCHTRALNDMAKVLRSACSSRSKQQQQQQQSPQQQPPPLAVPQANMLQQQQAHAAPGCAGAEAAGHTQTIQSIDASLASAGGGAGGSGSSSSGGGSSGQHAASGGTAPFGKSVAGELPAFTGVGCDLTPRAAVEALLAFVTDVTDAQRQVLEEAAAKSSKKGPEFMSVLAGLPGKLDHAAVVAYRVGS